MTVSGKAVSGEIPASRAVMAAYEDIKPKVQELQSSNAQSIMLRYEVGVRLSRFRAKPETYEANLVAISQLLSSELNYRLAPPVLDSFVILVQTFPDAEEFRQVASRPMSNGDLLTWSHFRALFPLGPQRAKFRDQLLQQCWEKSWGYRELARAVRAVLTPRQSGQGRKPRAPGTPMSAAQQINEALRAMLNRGSAWENVLGEGLRESPDSMITDRLLAELETLAELLDGGRQLLRRLHRSVQEAIVQVREVIVQRARPTDGAVGSEDGGARREAVNGEVDKATSAVPAKRAASSRTKDRRRKLAVG